MADKDYIERRITTQDGLSLYVRDYPGPAETDLTPLLCLHGLTRNSKDFAGIGKYLGMHRRVIVPDIRGRGKSDYDSNPNNYSPETNVGDVRHILCALGVHSVVVIGTSMGGIMGMGMAAAIPGAMKALVLNDIGPHIRRETLKAIIDYMKDVPAFAEWSEAGEQLKNAFGDQMPHLADEDWLRGAMISYRERDDKRITFDFDPNILKPILADDTEVFDLWHLFKATTKIPVLTIRGELSRILDAAQLDKMAACHSNFESAIVPGVGHAPSLAEPASLEALNGFLNRY